MTKAKVLGPQTIGKLQELIRVGIDSTEGFRQAAETTRSPALRDLFQTLAEERRNFAEELSAHVRGNDVDPVDKGTYLAKLHRWWLDVRGSLANDNGYALLAEIERGEDAIKHAYEEVLKETAGSPVNDVLLRHYAVVKKQHDKIRDLRDTAKEKK